MRTAFGDRRGVFTKRVFSETVSEGARGYFLAQSPQFGTFPTSF